MQVLVSLLVQLQHVSLDDLVLASFHLGLYVVGSSELVLDEVHQVLVLLPVLDRLVLFLLIDLREEVGRGEVGGFVDFVLLDFLVVLYSLILLLDIPEPLLLIGNLLFSLLLFVGHLGQVLHALVGFSLHPGLHVLVFLLELVVNRGGYFAGSASDLGFSLLPLVLIDVELIRSRFAELLEEFLVLLDLLSLQVELGLDLVLLLFLDGLGLGQLILGDLVLFLLEGL